MSDKLARNTVDISRTLYIDCKQEKVRNCPMWSQKSSPIGWRTSTDGCWCPMPWPMWPPPRTASQSRRSRTWSLWTTRCWTTSTSIIYHPPGGYHHSSGHVSGTSTIYQYHLPPPGGYHHSSGHVSGTSTICFNGKNTCPFCVLLTKLLLSLVFHDWSCLNNN